MFHKFELQVTINNNKKSNISITLKDILQLFYEKVAPIALISIIYTTVKICSNFFGKIRITKWISYCF